MTVNDYLTAQDAEKRAALEHIRMLIKSYVPDSVELISYGVPGFTYKSKYLFGYAAFKKHLSIFPTSEPIAVLQDKLKRYKTSQGTIQFTLDKPIPDEVITQLISIRIARIDS